MDWFDKTITIEEEGTSAVEAANNMIGFATGIVTVIGVFVIIGGALVYFRSLADDNPRERSNASVTLGIGIFMFAMPQIIKVLFT